MSDPFSIVRAAQECGDAPFLVSPSGSLSYRAMAERVRAAQRSLERRGVRPGDDRPWPLVADNDVASLSELLALIELAVPARLVHPRWPEHERRRIQLEDQERIPCHGRDPILAVVHTSGSAGTPRGVLLGRRALLCAGEASAQNLGWRDDDRWLLSLPLCHVGGLNILLRCLCARKSVGLVEGDLARSIGATASTLLSLVPAQLHALLTSEAPCPPALRGLLLGGAAAPPALVRAAHDAGYPVLLTYGATETAGQVTTQVPGTRDPSHTGPPLPGVELRLRAGRIEVRGPTLASGFYPDAPLPRDPEGWFATQDLGAFTPDGELRVLGRADDVLVTGGENVLPLEVESVLCEHPDVLDAAVFGVPDAQYGQRIAAVLRVRGPALPRDLAAHLAERLAPFQRPRLFALAETLPRNANDKLDRKRIAAEFRERCLPLRD